MRDTIGKLVIALVAGLMLFGVTGPKLFKMFQIEGWLGGAQISEVVVTQKWHQLPDQHESNRDTYWISWSDKDIREVGDHRINVTSKKWAMSGIGDVIEIVHVPGDSSPYMRDGIFCEMGNFILDGILLLVELFAFVYLFITGIREIKRRRSHAA